MLTSVCLIFVIVTCARRRNLQFPLLDLAISFPSLPSPHFLPLPACPHLPPVTCLLMTILPSPSLCYPPPRDLASHHLYNYLHPFTSPTTPLPSAHCLPLLTAALHYRSAPRRDLAPRRPDPRARLCLEGRRRHARARHRPPQAKLSPAMHIFLVPPDGKLNMY